MHASVDEATFLDRDNQFDTVASLFARRLEVSADVTLSMRHARTDTGVRELFKMTLDSGQKRELFLAVARRPNNWPRMRALFGAPPYAFLHATDATLFNARGFARARRNMSYATTQIENSTQFGQGIWQDEDGRQYKSVSDADASQFGIKLKKKLRSAGIATARGASFPRLGETVVLCHTAAYRAHTLTTPVNTTVSELRLRVIGVQSRKLGARTGTVALQQC